VRFIFGQPLLTNGKNCCKAMMSFKNREWFVRTRTTAEEYLYSSAMDYFINEKGLLNVKFIA
jgi:hypothetical protein